MTKVLLENNSVFSLTNTIASKIDVKFFKLRSSFNSLYIYEIFLEIVRNRGLVPVVDFDLGNHEQMQESVLRQLDASLKALPESDDVNQVLRETFYLGMLCNTIIHTNISLPEELRLFGKVEVSPEDIDNLFG